MSFVYFNEAGAKSPGELPGLQVVTYGLRRP